MSEQAEKKVPVWKLERITERKFWSYEAASAAKTVLTVQPMTPQTEELIKKTVKVKIFARHDGTFDLVFYKKIGPLDEAMKQISTTLTPKEQEALVADAKENGTLIEVKKVHGLRSKDRKKSRQKGTD